MFGRNVTINGKEVLGVVYTQYDLQRDSKAGRYVGEKRGVQLCQSSICVISIRPNCSCVA